MVDDKMTCEEYLHFDYKNKISHWPQGNYLESLSQKV